jgi:tetratricopeptide (TPR) repeat protein
MGGVYGMSQAAMCIRDGRYEDAIVEATKAHRRDDEDPAPLVDRAEAHALLERWDEAVADLEQAVALDAEAGVLEIDTVDDTYFSTLLGAAKKEAATSVDRAVARLGRYGEVFPAGRHVKDAADWARRLRGELKSEFQK